MSEDGLSAESRRHDECRHYAAARLLEGLREPLARRAQLPLECRAVESDAPIGLHEDEQYVAARKRLEARVQRRGGQHARHAAARERIDDARDLSPIRAAHGDREARY